MGEYLKGMIDSTEKGLHDIVTLNTSLASWVHVFHQMLQIYQLNLKVSSKERLHEHFMHVNFVSI